jgi:hypothetical protein
LFFIFALIIVDLFSTFPRAKASPTPVAIFLEQSYQDACTPLGNDVDALFRFLAKEKASQLGGVPVFTQENVTPVGSPDCTHVLRSHGGPCPYEYVDAIRRCGSNEYEIPVVWRV